MSESLNFNLKLYRERLADKYSKSPIESRFEQQNSFVANQRRTPISKDQQNAPTLGSLASKLQDYSNKKQKLNDSYLFKSGKKDQNPSPSKINGMHQKIQSISSQSPPPSQSNLGFPGRVHHQNSLTQFNGIQSPIQQQRYIGSPNHYSSITERPDSQQRKIDGTVEITNLIPLHEVVNMRNKLENTNVNLTSITSTYLTEFMRLSNVIQQKFQGNKK